MDNKCFYNVTTFTQETIGESNDFKVILTNQEKLVCLREILGKLKKVLYVYDKGLEDPKYNYKVFCGGILIYVSSSNTLFEGELVNLVINLNAIINNDFDKKQVKRIIFERRGHCRCLQWKDHSQSKKFYHETAFRESD